MNDIIKIVKYLEDSGLLLKGVTETVQDEVLGNILTGRGINRAGKGHGINRAGEGLIVAGYGSRSSKMDF